MIEAHNQEAALGLHSYELGMNHLGDMVRNYGNKWTDAAIDTIKDEKMWEFGVVADVRGSGGEDDGPGDAHDAGTRLHYESRATGLPAAQVGGLPQDGHGDTCQRPGVSFCDVTYMHDNVNWLYYSQVLEWTFKRVSSPVSRT